MVDLHIYLLDILLFYLLSIPLLYLLSCHIIILVNGVERRSKKSRHFQVFPLVLVYNHERINFYEKLAHHKQ